MKARRLKDNEIVDVIRYEKPINRDEVYVDGKLRLYLPSDLDFDVEEAEQTETDLRISVAKLREILMDMADLRGILREWPVDEIINRVKKEI